MPSVASMSHNRRRRTTYPTLRDIGEVLCADDGVEGCSRCGFKIRLPDSGCRADVVAYKPESEIACVTCPVRFCESYALINQSAYILI
jgi:hypothetical protein